MTFSKDQIQALITEIDGVLQKPAPRLPWVSGEVTQQRRVLERVRNYLVALQKQLPAAQNRSLSRTDLLSYDISYQPDQSGAGAQNAQQMLQTVMQEMNQLRSTLMQPLQADLSAMQQQREALRQEIQQLESQRRSYGSGNQQVTNEFLQVLMGRLQENLPAQIQAAEPARSLQPQSDQTILNLDATLRAVFDALQRDMQAYQESMAQGLDRMHSLGQQSEMMFNALITHLAQQLGRETSSYLQASGQISAPPTVAAAPSYPSLPPKPPAPPPSFELPKADLNAASPPSSVDQAIDSWLQSMGASSSDSSAVLPESTGNDVRLNSQEIDALLEPDSPAAAQPSIDAPTTPSTTARPLPEDSTDIDAALRLLQQLSTKLESSARPASASAPAAIAPLEEDGLDEFYELFDGGATATGDLGEIVPNSAGQFSAFAGLDATGSFDPTHGWDVLEPAPSQPVLSETFATSEATAEPIDPTNQITSLQDLFEEDLFEQDLPPAPPIKAPAPPQTPTPQERNDSFSGRQDDRYVAAAPEENLLPIQESGNAPHQEFWLDDLTLSRLSEDLSSLESGRRNSAPDQVEAAQPNQVEGFDTFDMTFADLTTDLSGNEANTEPVPAIDTPRSTPTDAGAVEPSTPRSADSNINQSFAFTLDDLDDLDELFEEPRLVPEVVPVTPVVPVAPVAPPPATVAQTSAPLPPIADPVPPLSQPVASVSESFAFILEGMDDLFNEGPAPVTVSIPPPDSSPPTLDEPLGFTLEGMDDLFADGPLAESVNPPSDTPKQ